MATLDNIDDNLVYYTEQNQIHPENDTLRHEMDKAKIVSIIKNNAFEPKIPQIYAIIIANTT